MEAGNDSSNDNPAMKRIPIRKCRICDIASASVAEEGNGNFFESPVLGRIARVHIFGTVMDNYVSQDKNYAFFAIDDTTGVIRCKVFGNTASIADVKAGQMLDVIGRIREYNSERYIMPEITRACTDPNMETLRWLQIAQALNGTGAAGVPAASAEDAKQETPAEAKAEVKADAEKEIPKDARVKILEAIGASGDGAEYNMIATACGFPEDVVQSVVAELLSEGTCYEPRPGKIRIL